MRPIRSLSATEFSGPFEGDTDPVLVRAAAWSNGTTMPPEEGGELPPDLGPGVTINAGAVLDGLGTALGDLSGFIGSLAGEFLDGLLGPLLDSFKEDLLEVLEELEDTLQNLIEELEQSLSNVLEDSIQELDATLQRQVKAALGMMLMTQDLLAGIRQGVFADVIVLIMETDIGAYNATQGLPFASDDPRLVYVRPFWFRGGDDSSNSNLVLRGNFLDKFDDFKVGGYEANVVAQSDNEVTLKMPEGVAALIAASYSKNDLTVEAINRRFLLTDPTSSIALPILPRMEVSLKAKLWPVYTKIEYKTMKANHDSGATDDDSRSVTKPFRLPSRAKYINHERTYLNKNRDSKIYTTIPALSNVRPFWSRSRWMSSNSN